MERLQSICLDREVDPRSRGVLFVELAVGSGRRWRASSLADLPLLQHMSARPHAAGASPVADGTEGGFSTFSFGRVGGCVNLLGGDSSRATYVCVS